MSYANAAKVNSAQASFEIAMVKNGQQSGGKVLNEKGCPVQASTNVAGIDAFHKLVRDGSLETKTGKVLSTRINKYNSLNRHISDSDVRGGNNTEDSNKSISKQKFNGIPDPETKTGRDSVRKYINAMLEDAKTRAVSEKDTTELVRTFIMPFLKRRTTRSDKSNSVDDNKFNKKQTGGEGERLLFYQIYLELYKEYPYTMRQLLGLIPKYGYWKDVFAIWNLWEWRLSENEPNTPVVCHEFQCAVLHLVWSQLTDDKLAMEKDGKNASISLCAKWVPSEFKKVRKGESSKQMPRDECMITTLIHGHKVPKYNAYTALAVLFFNGYKGSDNTIDSCEPGVLKYWGLKAALCKSCDKVQLGKARRQMRVKYLSPMRSHLSVVESLMCAGKWSGVDPAKVPSRAQHRYQRAFLDESVDGVRRHEGDVERDVCRANFMNLLVDPSNIKTAGVDPHEILREFRAATSTAQKQIKRLAWSQKVKEVYQSIVDKRKELEEAGEDIPRHLGHLIGMADVSGSMCGQPMEVSIALTLFLAALQEEAGYKPLAISFTDVPMAFDFTGMTLEQRVDKITSHIGYSTDFGAAMKLVLDTIKSTGHYMDMVVFTDEQFDTQYSQSNNQNRLSGWSIQSNKNPANAWKTFHENYLKEVAEAGLENVPRVVYWNLRAHTQGVHTDAQHPGVQMLQGYNLNNLRFVLFADGVGQETEVEVEVTDTETGEKTIRKVKTTKVTPYDTYCAAMNDEAFDAVREVLYASEEKLLKLVKRPDMAVASDAEVVAAVDSTTTSASASASVIVTPPVEDNGEAASEESNDDVENPEDGVEINIKLVKKMAREMLAMRNDVDYLRSKLSSTQLQQKR